MSINYKGTNITNVVYKGTTLDYVYKWDGSKYILVFSRKTIYSYTIYLSLSKTSYQVDTSTTTKEWDDWNTEYERLGGVVEDAKKAWDDYPKTHTEPNQYTDGWIKWNNDLVEKVNNRNTRAKYYNTVMIPQHKRMVDEYNRRVGEVNDAKKAYNTHHKSSKPPATIPNPNFDDRVSINNPDYAPWVIEDSKLYHKWQDLIGSPYEADAKKAYEAHHNNPPPTKIPNPNFDDRATLDNSAAVKAWEDEDDRLWGEYNRLGEAWEADEPGQAKALTDLEDSMIIYGGSIETMDKEIEQMKQNEYTPKDNPDYKKYWDDMSRLEVDYNLAKEAKRKWWGKQPYKWVKETRYDYTAKVSTSRALVDGYIDATFSIGGNNVTVSLRAGESSKSGYYNGTTSNYSSATTKMSTPAGTYDSSVNVGSSINYNLEW